MENYGLKVTENIELKLYNSCGVTESLLPTNDVFNIQWNFMKVIVISTHDHGSD